MTETVNEPVSVSFSFYSDKMSVEPRALIWKGRLYGIKKVGLHHTFRQGRTLFHVFSVASKAMFFRLILNTDNLHWRLEQISDGMTS